MVQTKYFFLLRPNLSAKVRLMNTKRNLKILAALLSLLLLETKVQAYESKNSDYEEVSYEDLVNELSQQNKIAANKNTPARFDSGDMKIHAGVGYATSFSSVSFGDSTSNRFLSGVQLSLGIDIFSQHLFSEVVFKNFGIDSRATDSLSVKQLDLRLGYRDQVSGPWGYKLGAGLSNRYIKYTANEVSENSTVPALSIHGAMEAIVSRSLSLGLEVAGRTPLVEQKSDRGSLDMSLRMNALF